MVVMLRLSSVLLALLLAAPASALESSAVVSPRTTATLVSDQDAIVPGAPLRLGLRLRLAPGWHSYWQNPGDAGLPAELSLTLPAGTAGPIAWPTPEVQHEGPLVTYGYTGDLLLPVQITGAAPGHITASASWLACRDICIPEEASLSLDIPSGSAPSAADAARFAAADQNTPRPAPFTAQIGPDSVLRVTGLPAAPVRAARFIPDRPDLVRNAAPQPLATAPGMLTLALSRPDHPAEGPLSGLLLLTDAAGQSSALTITATPVATTAPAATPAPNDQSTTWPAILALGLLGGLILNLMPCVFPVLAMKALGFARLAGARRRQVRGEALSYTLGVLLSFAALGGLLLALRDAGAAVGWGLQFSSPAAVAAMAWVLFAVGLNLSGLLAVSGRLAGLGAGLASRGGHAGSFFTGLLAVLVATPCTAPFMATALAAAATAPPALAMACFLSIGLGLAAPTLLFAVIPSLSDHLPRPGRWMDLLRQALAFPMYGSVVWLVWVISQQTGPTGVLIALIGLLLLGIIAWLLSLRAGLARILAATAVVGLAALLVTLTATTPAPAGTTMAQDQAAEPFSPDRLASLRAQGRPVFVNLTAAWCVTCLVNERIALDQPEVHAAFARHDIAYLLGDWTRQDPIITSFLRSRHRDGVPLYLFYPAGAAAPIELPQILTPAGVLRVLEGG